MTTGTTRPLRRDAEANRQKILDAASELFATRGLGVTLNDIAHHARVGVGTAYRRFANKEELFEALLEERLEELARCAHAALADPDPWRGFIEFLERSIELQRQNRGLAEIMSNPDIQQPRLLGARDRMTPLIEQIAERAKVAGTLRADFAATDVVFLQMALAAIMESTRNASTDLYRRYLAMFLDGVRASDDLEPLPVAAFTPAQTHQMMTQSGSDFAS